MTYPLFRLKSKGEPCPLLEAGEEVVVWHLLGRPGFKKSFDSDPRKGGEWESCGSIWLFQSRLVTL